MMNILRRSPEKDIKSAVVAIVLTLLLSDSESPEHITPELVIDGFTSVTVPLEPTGSGKRYDVGGGNNFSKELSGVPWQSLKPGDIVNIYYRDTPYQNKILLSEQGTADHPITIHGVTNQFGDRPTISAENASSINSTEWDNDYRSALIMINKRKNTGIYGENAEHYLIQNLRLTGARSKNSFTHDGVVENYPDGARAIWSAGGQHITLQSMIIEDNGSGIFIQANDDPGSMSRNWKIRGCKFSNNGYNNRDHQVYLQAISMPGEKNIVEGNYFAAPTPNQESIAQLKVRATSVVIRYNYFSSSHRTIDLVEAQDAIPNWMYENYTPSQILSLYRSSHIYGNVFVNDFDASGQPASRPLHFGADSLDSNALFGGNGVSQGQPAMRGYQSPTYFYHNTFYMNASYPSGIYRGSLFDLENNNSEITPTPGEVHAWNNIFEFSGNTRIGAVNRSGKVDFKGANLLYKDTLTIFADSDRRARDEDPTPDPNTNILFSGTRIDQTAKLSSEDYTLLEGSPAINAAVILPGHLYPVTLQPNARLGGASLRESVTDLGAYQFTP